jgi:peptidoglycan/xylan/chitin deacetylase (PgdA/CDA1 family)
MYFVNSPFVISNLSKKNLIWQLPSCDKEVFLTFDDGPVPEVTSWVLNLLKNYKIKATFFCVGENVKRNPDLFSRIIDEGHSVGNHTYNHLNAWNTPNDEYFKNVDMANVLIKSKFFRPPYGKINISQIKHLRKQYAIVLWSVLSGDFDLNISPEKCFENSTKNVKQGSIIVFHDSIKAEKNLKYALPLCIEHVLSKGFEFKPLTLDVCIKNSNIQRKYLVAS